MKTLLCQQRLFCGLPERRAQAPGVLEIVDLHSLRNGSLETAVLSAATRESLIAAT